MQEKKSDNEAKQRQKQTAGSTQVGCLQESALSDSPTGCLDDLYPQGIEVCEWTWLDEAKQRAEEGKCVNQIMLMCVPFFEGVNRCHC